MPCPFASHKDIFGAPGTGAHSVRILDIAVIDLVLTVVVAFAISKVLSTSPFWTIVFFLVLGEVAHALFCVDTTVIKMIKRAYNWLISHV